MFIAGDHDAMAEVVGTEPLDDRQAVQRQVELGRIAAGTQVMEFTPRQPVAYGKLLFLGLLDYGSAREQQL